MEQRNIGFNKLVMAVFLAIAMAIALVVNASPAMADEQTSSSKVTIGTKRDGESLVAPFGTNGLSSYAVMLYRQSEINTEGKITSVAFKIHDEYWTPIQTNNVQIYMGHTSKTVLAPGPAEIDYEIPEDMTLVYEGSPTIAEQPGWQTFTFNKNGGAFTYNNTDNLVIAVIKDAKEYELYQPRFVYQKVTGYRVIYKQNQKPDYYDLWDLDEFSSAGSVGQGSLPWVQFGFGESAPVTVDKTALKTAIDEATAAKEGVETSEDGKDVDPKDKYVTPAEKKALDDAITAAQEVANNPEATQKQVDDAAAAVKAAQDTYDAAKKDGKKEAPKPIPVTTKTALKSATAKNQNYTGKALKPAVTVKDAKGNTVPASAYTVKYTNNVNPGTATATVTAKKDSKYTGTVKATFKITAKDTPVYWMYNKNTGENLYTAALPEKNALSKKPQWQFKKIVWYAPTTGEPVYRLVNKVTNDHHWTKSKTEANTLVKRGKWKMDFGGKPAFYSGGGKTVWRLRHDARITQQKAGTHRFATSTKEINTLKKSKWVKESETLKATRYK